MDIKYFVLENTWLQRGRSEFGWGNGYVVLPEGHAMHGMDYDTIHEKYPIEVHGGLTYANKGQKLRVCPDWVTEKDWVIGFDTCHSGDSLDNWPDAETVAMEAKKLAEQCEIYKYSFL